eukprot:TRINITY_DN37681_c0_g1_i1.p1 TRINITY_DN37681_c0_g1~~TRINITY_DN37681_c0_g1_i1.p1  ORF type:complete len:1259 (+),score=266.28 TRINITY_DN37681_c0_g1_i1:105-3881(+)
MNDDEEIHEQLEAVAARAESWKSETDALLEETRSLRHALSELSAAADANDRKFATELAAQRAAAEEEGRQLRAVLANVESTSAAARGCLEAEVVRLQEEHQEGAVAALATKAAIAGGGVDGGGISASAACSLQLLQQLEATKQHAEAAEGLCAVLRRENTLLRRRRAPSLAAPVPEDVGSSSSSGRHRLMAAARAAGAEVVETLQRARSRHQLVCEQLRELKETALSTPCLPAADEWSTHEPEFFSVATPDAESRSLKRRQLLEEAAEAVACVKEVLEETTTRAADSFSRSGRISFFDSPRSEADDRRRSPEHQHLFSAAMEAADSIRELCATGQPGVALPALDAWGRTAEHNACMETAFAAAAQIREALLGRPTDLEKHASATSCHHGNAPQRALDSAFSPTRAHAEDGRTLEQRQVVLEALDAADSIRQALSDLGLVTTQKAPLLAQRGGVEDGSRALGQREVVLEALDAADCIRQAFSDLGLMPKASLASLESSPRAEERKRLMSDSFDVVADIKRQLKEASEKMSSSRALGECQARVDLQPDEPFSLEASRGSSTPTPRKASRRSVRRLIGHLEEAQGMACVWYDTALLLHCWLSWTAVVRAARKRATPLMAPTPQQRRLHLTLETSAAAGCGDAAAGAAEPLAFSPTASLCSSTAARRFTPGPLKDAALQPRSLQQRCLRLLCERAALRTALLAAALLGRWKVETVARRASLCASEGCSSEAGGAAAAESAQRAHEETSRLRSLLRSSRGRLAETVAAVGFLAALEWRRRAWLLWCQQTRAARARRGLVDGTSRTEDLRAVVSSWRIVARSEHMAARAQALVAKASCAAGGAILRLALLTWRGACWYAEQLELTCQLLSKLRCTGSLQRVVRCWHGCAHALRDIRVRKARSTTWVQAFASRACERQLRAETLHAWRLAVHASRQASIQQLHSQGCQRLLSYVDEHCSKSADVLLLRSSFATWCQVHARQRVEAATCQLTQQAAERHSRIMQSVDVLLDKSVARQLADAVFQAWRHLPRKQPPSIVEQPISWLSQSVRNSRRQPWQNVSAASDGSRAQLADVTSLSHGSAGGSIPPEATLRSSRAASLQSGGGCAHVRGGEGCSMCRRSSAIFGSRPASICDTPRISTPRLPPPLPCSPRVGASVSTALMTSFAPGSPVSSTWPSPLAPGPAEPSPRPSSSLGLSPDRALPPLPGSPALSARSDKTDRRGAALVMLYTKGANMALLHETLQAWRWNGSQPFSARSHSRGNAVVR